jgi:hypothetical protein
MAKFADRGRVAVQIDGDPHIIYVKAEMDVATRAAVLDALKVVTDGNGGTGFAAGAYTLAQLKHFIIGWSGPDFDGVEVTAESISMLSASDPLVKEVIKVMGVRYPLG